MAKSSDSVKSMGDVSISGMTKRGKGFVASKGEKDGEIVGVDRTGSAVRRVKRSQNR